VQEGTIILGGGIAGLAAARATGAPVYEAADTVGGTCRSRRAGGFTFDYGIHVLQTDDAVVQGMLAEAGVRLLTRKRVAHIYSHRRYTAYPFQVNTAGLPLALRLRCVWRYLRRDRGASPADYQQWIYGTMGEGFGDAFMIPYSLKFWTVHPRAMTCDWTGNRVPRVSAWQVLRGALVSRQTRVGSNAVFQYPAEGGYGQICSKLAESLPRVHLNSRATRIDTDARLVAVDGAAGEVPYETLISTIPLPALVGLMPQAPDAVRSAAALLRCNSIFVVNLGIDRPDVSRTNWAHFPEPGIIFFRISYPHTFAPGMAPEGTSSVAAEVAYSPARPLDREGIVERVIEDLVAVGAIRDDDRIVVRDTMDIEHGYVIYDRHHAGAVRTIHDWLATVGVQPAGRYGMWQYLWSHEALLSGLAAAGQGGRRTD
jgi:UDP-galactopyranose mutase